MTPRGKSTASFTTETPSVGESETTPLLTQYLNLKAQHPDCLLFFRLGDFYEMFFEDATEASKALDIALTRRGQFQGRDVPMCGIPVHAYENYLSRLIRRGFRVAICEQTEDPSEARKRGSKAIVNREVVRVVTPGTITEDSLLDARAANYLACLVTVDGVAAVAWLDLGEGRPRVRAFANNAKDNQDSAIAAALAEIAPQEIITPERLANDHNMADLLAPWQGELAPQPDSRFDPTNAKARLCSTYEVSDMAAFGEFSEAETTAVGALLDYAALTQKTDLGHLLPPVVATNSGTMTIDPATRRNLELTRTLEGERRGSLLAAIDRTVTGAGARLLLLRLSAPLTDAVIINARLDAVEWMLRQTSLRDGLRKLWKAVPDLERALARLALGRGGPRDLAAIRDALGIAEQTRSLMLAADLGAANNELLEAANSLAGHEELHDILASALSPDAPMLARDGGFIARGWSPQLDELLTLRDDSRRVVAGLQHKYAEHSGVDKLKICHNNIIGFHIEVTPLNADRLLAHKDTFIHRQSLASAVRFTTVELGELDRKISEAASRAVALELQLFADLTAKVLARLQELRGVATGLAVLDVACGLAELAEAHNYVRPWVDNSLSFDIKNGRHPVVEQAISATHKGEFIGNDCDLAATQRLWLLTGPNMAGKSTFLRQNALIAMLAQSGSFVPATSAHIGIIDRLFSRVGAADDLARGQSTFMVEMVETAAILNQASERSLVILDEIGRGTATYDGLSIAWATLEHLHQVCRCRALFATHYHELTALATHLPSLRLVTMKIREWQDGIIFLHEVIAGRADRSYGIHVARMAGLPPSVTRRAETILAQLERGDSLLSSPDLPLFAAAAPASLPPVVQEVLDVLSTTNPDTLSPREAMDVLYRLREIASKNVGGN